MSALRTLIDGLAERAQEMPTHEIVRFRFAPGEETAVTYSELWSRSRAFASRLRASEVGPGSRVMIAIPNSPEFLIAFYGTLAAGAVAVPVYASAGSARTLRILKHSQSRALVLTAPSAGHGNASILRKAARSAGVALVEVGEASPPVRGMSDSALPELDPNQVALLQYTSGSTGNPRGVQITHAHLLTNVGQMREGMGITADDIFVSWLPVYHDMGLILMALTPVSVGARLVLLPTSLHSPHAWLSAITEHEGTFTAAPDTAYRLCALRGSRAGRYNLSSLRVALNAAEPVRPSTVAAFERAFGLTNVVAPGYGLAEATVGVSMWPPGTPIKIDAAGRPSVGPPFPGITIRIVGERGEHARGEPGEIAVRSPATSLGYLDNPEANASLWWNGDYLLTGDLGYLDTEGDLYIVGRKKNVIHQAGQTLYAADVEGSVADLPFARRVAAIGVPGRRALGEQLLVFVEIGRHRLPPDDTPRRFSAEVVRRIHARFGLRPARVYLVAPRSLPHTPNGKLRHGALRADFLEGKLKDRILFPDY